jgi:hypothetical protein
VAGAYDAAAEAKTAQHAAHLDRLNTNTTSSSSSSSSSSSTSSGGIGGPEPGAAGSAATDAAAATTTAAALGQPAPPAAGQLCTVASDSLRRLWRRLGPVVRGSGGRLLQVALDPVPDSALTVTKHGRQIPEKVMRVCRNARARWALQRS